MQAELLATRFRWSGLAPVHVYSSPLVRAMETAHTATACWEIPVMPWPDLVEYDVGVFSGLTWPEIEQMCPTIAQRFASGRNWDLVPGAETVAERTERARRVVSTMVERHGDEDVIILVTHGGVLQYMLSALLATKHVWGFTASNTALFDFLVKPSALNASRAERLHTHLRRIVAFNNVDHLAGGHSREGRRDPGPCPGVGTSDSDAGP